MDPEKRPLDAVGDYWREICMEVSTDFSDYEMKEFDTALSFWVYKEGTGVGITIDLEQKTVEPTGGGEGFHFDLYEPSNLLTKRTRTLLQSALSTKGTT